MAVIYSITGYYKLKLKAEKRLLTKNVSGQVCLLLFSAFQTTSQEILVKYVNYSKLFSL